MRKQASSHVLGLHFMGDIDDARLRVNGEHDPFHDAHVGVFRAEVSENRYDAHACLGEEHPYILAEGLFE